MLLIQDCVTKAADKKLKAAGCPPLLFKQGMKLFLFLNTIQVLYLNGRKEKQDSVNEEARIKHEENQ